MGRNYAAGAGWGRAEETLGWLIRRGSVRREERSQGNMETWSQVWSVSPVLGVGEREIWSDLGSRDNYGFVTLYQSRCVSRAEHL